MTEQTEILGHRIPRLTRGLHAETVAALEATGRVDAAWLDRHLPPPRYEHVRLVATGLYNSGKSTILRVLTGDEGIVIDADIATDVCQTYEWNDVFLVDTPGVRAGVPHHDERADIELRKADLVIFVVSVGLPDDDAREHLDYVSNYLGRADDTVLVLNKTSLSAADPDIRMMELRKLTGRLAIDPPIVMIDARDVLLADAAAEEDREELLDRSHFVDLVRELNRITRERGAGAQLASPLHSLVVGIAEADALLAEPGWERDALRLLAAREAVVERARASLLSRLRTLEANARRDIVEMGDELAEALTFEGGGITGKQRQEFSDNARQRATRLLQDIGEEFERVAVAMQQQDREIEAGPAAQALRTWFESESIALGDPVLEDVGRDPIPSGSGEWSERARAAKEWSRKFAMASAWVAQQVGDPSHGPGHKWILEIGHFFGYKFRPYEAVRWAGRIGKAGEVAAKWAPLIGVVAEVAGQFMDERAEAQRLTELREAQDEIRGEVSSAAEFLISQVREESIQKIEEAFDQFRQPVEEARRELEGIESRRDGTRAGLARIRRDAQDLLSELR